MNELVPELPLIIAQKIFIDSTNNKKKNTRKMWDWINIFVVYR